MSRSEPSKKRTSRRRPEPDTRVRPLSSLAPGARGRIARVMRDLMGRAERLAALGVGPGASVHVLQTFPGIVFECDQTELAVERAVARSILVRVEERAAATAARPHEAVQDTQGDKPRNLSCVSLFRMMVRGSCREGI